MDGSKAPPMLKVFPKCSLNFLFGLQSRPNEEYVDMSSSMESFEPALEYSRRLGRYAMSQNHLEHPTGFSSWSIFLRPDHCYRAATADGSNAIFVISAHEENQLATEGRLGKEKQLVSMASKVVAETVGR
ncbi:hypothetical protein N7450_011684 [Penicillium hetheringtonii]|uniref:Uncharacterized protein n=1 Tax=Penicillium hetheringtonii TaxID=911720 RepID=A0AAD6DAR0_9EURO|nr:hypothetical protein N7450_011684 [Penicillium hetheringtonii]